MEFWFGGLYDLKILELVSGATTDAVVHLGSVWLSRDVNVTIKIT